MVGSDAGLAAGLVDVQAGVEVGLEVAEDRPRSGPVWVVFAWVAPWLSASCTIPIKTGPGFGGQARERTVTTHYYITSHPGTAAEFGRWIRGRWSIENGLHWVLDVVFREDRSRIRAENAGANLAMIRRVAVSLLRRAPGKGSGVTKRLKAGWMRVIPGASLTETFPLPWAL